MELADSSKRGRQGPGGRQEMEEAMNVCRPIWRFLPSPLLLEGWSSHPVSWGLAAVRWTSLLPCLGRRGGRCAVLQGCRCRSQLMMGPGVGDSMPGTGPPSSPFSACSPGCALWSGSEALTLLPPQETSARSTFLFGCTVSQACCSSAHAVSSLQPPGVLRQPLTSKGNFTAVHLHPHQATRALLQLSPRQISRELLQLSPCHVSRAVLLLQSSPRKDSRELLAAAEQSTQGLQGGCCCPQSSPRKDSRELLLLLQSSPRKDSRELLLLLLQQSSPRKDSRELLLLLLLQSSPRKDSRGAVVLLLLLQSSPRKDPRELLLPEQPTPGPQGAAAAEQSTPGLQGAAAAAEQSTQDSRELLRCRAVHARTPGSCCFLPEQSTPGLQGAAAAAEQSTPGSRELLLLQSSPRQDSRELLLLQSSPRQDSRELPFLQSSPRQGLPGGAAAAEQSTQDSRGLLSAAEQSPRTPRELLLLQSSPRQGLQGAAAAAEQSTPGLQGAAAVCRAVHARTPGGCCCRAVHARTPGAAAAAEQSPPGLQGAAAAAEQSTPGIQGAAAAAEQSTPGLQGAAAAAEQSTPGLQGAAAAAEQSTPGLQGAAAAAEQSTPGLQGAAAAEQSTPDLQSAVELSEGGLPPFPGPEHLLSFLWGVLTELKPDTHHDRPQSDTPHPDTPQPVSARSDTPQPVSARSDTPQPVSARSDTPQPVSARPDSPQPDSGSDLKSASTSSTRRRGRRKRDASVHATGGLGDASAPAHATEGLCDASAPAHATEGLGDASALAHATEGPADASAPSLQGFSGKRVLVLAPKPCDEGEEGKTAGSCLWGLQRTVFSSFWPRKTPRRGVRGGRKPPDPVSGDFKEQFFLVLASEPEVGVRQGSASAPEGSPGSASAPGGVRQALLRPRRVRQALLRPPEGSPGSASAPEGSPGSRGRPPELCACSGRPPGRPPELCACFGPPAMAPPPRPVLDHNRMKPATMELADSRQESARDRWVRQEMEEAMKCLPTDLEVVPSPLLLEEMELAPAGPGSGRGAVDLFTFLSREAERTLRRSAGLSVPQSAYDGSGLAIPCPGTGPLRRRSLPAPLAMVAPHRTPGNGEEILETLPCKFLSIVGKDRKKLLPESLHHLPEPTTGIHAINILLDHVGHPVDYKICHFI
ncbi:hypothetical protein CRENBAI_004084 [Crenichthys baileyi]|uniref:Uncharacterized protein n=1 Tax=Crenichthys baileyi TaxID=28760 RepID=A0AAV9SCK8_9TELE